MAILVSFVVMRASGKSVGMDDHAVDPPVQPGPLRQQGLRLREA